jgi:hypothetical protein
MFHTRLSHICPIWILLFISAGFAELDFVIVQGAKEAVQVRIHVQ